MGTATTWAWVILLVTVAVAVFRKRIRRALLYSGMTALERHCYSLPDPSINCQLLQILGPLYPQSLSAEESLPEVLNACRCNRANPLFSTILQPRLLQHLRFLQQERELAQQTRSLAATQYDKRNAEHEEQLLRLWAQLMPSRALCGRVSEDWSDVGFQGTDPATDFRGMGLLGLQQLLEFSGPRWGAAARAALGLSKHPSYGFPFACAGINISSWLLQALETGLLRRWFSEQVSRGLSISPLTFHFLYACVFDRFASHYVASQPEDIMSFGPIFASFKSHLEAQHFLFPTSLQYHSSSLTSEP